MKRSINQESRNVSSALFLSGFVLNPDIKLPCLRGQKPSSSPARQGVSADSCERTERTVRAPTSASPPARCFYSTSANHAEVHFTILQPFLEILGVSCGSRVREDVKTPNESLLRPKQNQSGTRGQNLQWGLILSGSSCSEALGCYINPQSGPR